MPYLVTCKRRHTSYLTWITVAFASDVVSDELNYRSDMIILVQQVSKNVESAIFSETYHTASVVMFG